MRPRDFKYEEKLKRSSKKNLVLEDFDKFLSSESNLEDAHSQKFDVHWIQNTVLEYENKDSTKVEATSAK